MDFTVKIGSRDDLLPAIKEIVETAKLKGSAPEVMEELAMSYWNCCIGKLNALPHIDDRVLAKMPRFDDVVVLESGDQAADYFAPKLDQVSEENAASGANAYVVSIVNGIHALVDHTAQLEYHNTCVELGLDSAHIHPKPEQLH